MSLVVTCNTTNDIVKVLVVPKYKLSSLFSSGLNVSKSKKTCERTSNYASNIVFSIVFSASHGFLGKFIEAF